MTFVSVLNPDARSPVQNSFTDSFTSSSRPTNTRRTSPSPDVADEASWPNMKGDRNGASRCKPKGRTEGNISPSTAWEFRATYSNLQRTADVFMHHIKYFALSPFMQTYTQYFTASVQQRTGFHTFWKIFTVP